MHLLLYLEAVQVLEKELKNNEFRISKFYSMQTWYCVTLLLFMGIIDQQTKNEKIIDKEEVEKTVGLKDRFFRVMSKLDESEQNIFLTTYLPEKKTFNNFKEVCDHLYGTRNFFAHDIENLDDSVPQTEYLSFSKSLDGQYVMHQIFTMDSFLC